MAEDKDPFAEFGGSKIVDDKDPFAEFGGSKLRGKPIQPVAPTGSKPSKTGSLPFQTQVDTSTPSVILSDEQKLRQEQERIGKRFETTFLNTPTEFGKVANFVDAAKKVKDTLPQAPQFRKYGQIPMTQPTEMTEGQRLGESLTKGTDVRELITDKLTNKKTGLQKQIEAAQDAFRQSQGGELVGEIQRAQQLQSMYPESVETERERKGNYAKYLYNQFLDGTGSAVSGLIDFGLAIDKNSPSASPIAKSGLILDYYRKKNAKGVKSFLKDNIGFEVDKGLEAKYNEGLLTGAIGGLASSAPTMLTGGMTKGLSMAAQMYDSAIQSVESMPNSDKWDNDTKTLFAGTLGLIQGQLEKYGLDKILKGGELTNVIFKKILNSAAGKEVTGNILEDLIDENVKGVARLFARGGVRAIDGFASEFYAGAGQEAAAIGVENLFDKVTGKPIFNTSNKTDWIGFVDRIVKAGGQEGLGGFVTGAGVGMLSAESKKKVKEGQAVINEIDRQLDSPNTQPEVMEVLLQRKADTQADIDDVVDAEADLQSKMNPEDFAKSQELSKQIEKIDLALQDPNTGESVKAVLESQKQAIEKEIDEILKKVPAVAQPTFDTEESIGEEIRESNRKFQAGEIDQATWEQEQKDLNKRAEDIIPVPEDAEIGKPEEVVSEDVEAKKSDIEKRRQEELNSLTDREKESIERSTKGTPITKDNPGATKVGDKFNDGLNVIVQDAQIADNFDPNIAENEGEGYTIIDRILEYGEMKDGKLSKAPVLRNRVFNNKADADAYLEQQKQKFGSQIGKSRQYDKINAKYDAELAALEQQTKPKEDAIQEQAAGQVPVQSEAPVSEKVEQGKPEAKPKVVAEEGKEVVGKPINVYHGGSVFSLEDINENEPFFVTESKKEATDYSKGNDGDVIVAKIDSSKIAKEDIARGILTKMGYSDEYMFHELIDPRFEESYIGLNDVNELFSKIKEKGYEGVEFNDSGLYDTRNIKNIVLISPKKTLANSGFENTRIVGETRAYDLLEEGFNPVVDGKILENVTEEELGDLFRNSSTVEMTKNELKAKPEVVTEEGVKAEEVGTVYSDKNGTEKVIVQVNKDGTFFVKNNDGKSQNPTIGDPNDLIGKTQEVTPAQQVEQLRADEQAELKTTIPNAEQYLTDGKVDRAKITDAKDLKKFDEIYDKYDKLITPLLPKKETSAPKQEAPAKAKALPKPKVATRLAFKKAVDLFYDISAADGSAKKGTLSRKRQRFLEQNPTIKYIDDNWNAISKQLEDKGLLTKSKGCP